MFLEADYATRFNGKEREEAIIGYMIRSPQNCDLVLKQITEDHFIHYKDHFKMVCKVYKEKGKINFDIFCAACKEIGFIRKTAHLEHNPDLETISWIMESAWEDEDLPLMIKLLLEANRNPQETERISFDPNMELQYSLCQKDIEGGKYIYDIQECERELGGTEILDSQRYSHVTASVTPDVTESESALSEKIRQWIEGTTDWFTYSQLDSELGIKTNADKNNRRAILKRLYERGSVQRHTQTEGKYRYVNIGVEKLDLKQSANKNLDIKLPFQIENYVKVYPGNLIVVAGSPNAGKKAFMLNVIKLNLTNYAKRIRYFCSEMGVEELRSRLDLFPMTDDELGRFEAVKKKSDFSDSIVPDWINIIDFLEMSTDLWVVNDHLRSQTSRQAKLNPVPCSLT